ncbi:MAG: zinc ribbon domain-containing protein [Bacilli bacterium]|nr:zinc ribbon domain-containing protein [Bacilli bacterium]
MAKFCVQCGNEIPEGNNVCTNCGTAVNGAPVAHAQPAQGGTTVVVNQTPAQVKKSNGMAIAGFVVSLVSTILCCGSLNMISLILSIIGVAKAKDYDGAGKGLAIAGIIISAIGIVVLLLLTIFGYAAAIIENASYNF